MAEYIERKAVLKEAESRIMWGASAAAVYELIRAIPAADVAPVRHGRWIRESDGGTRCSVCNKRVRDVTGGWDAPVDLSDMPYCPKCGAKLDGGDNNSDMT